MKKYALFVTFKSTVLGRGFTAEVSLQGRLLAAKEGLAQRRLFADDDQEGEDEWGFYGVNPGAIAAEGPSLEDAGHEFERAMHEVLVQFVSEASSFEEFRQEVERFFGATNKPTEAEWLEALERIRAQPEGLGGCRHSKLTCFM